MTNKGFSTLQPIHNNVWPITGSHLQEDAAGPHARQCPRRVREGEHLMRFRLYILNSKQILSRGLFMCLTVTRVVCKFIKLFVKFKHSPLVPENNFFETLKLKHILKGISVKVFYRILKTEKAFWMQKILFREERKDFSCFKLWTQNQTLNPR